MTILEKIPLKNTTKEKYTNFLAINENYYVLAPLSKKIIKYNNYTCDYSTLEFEEKYTSITYNRDNDNFYLIKDNDWKCIYVSDIYFNEINLINLCIPEKYAQKINDIHYCDIKKRIYITTNYFVYSVTEDGYFIKEEYCVSKIGEKIDFQLVKNLNGCFELEKTKVMLSDTYLTCCYALEDNLHIGYVRNKTAYLLNISLNRNVINNTYIDDGIEINSITDGENGIVLLVSNNKLFSYIYSTDLNYNNKIINKDILNDEEILQSISLTGVSIACMLDSISKREDKNSFSNNIINNITMLEKMILKKLTFYLKDGDESN